MERKNRIKDITRFTTLVGAAAALAVFGKVAERHGNAPFDELGEVKAFQSGEEQIDRANETLDKIVSRDQAEERSRWGAVTKWIANADKVSTPEPATNIIVGEYQALGIKPVGVQVENQINIAGETALEKYKAELPRILEIAGTHPESFPDVEALQMYYPIYRASGERFGIPWELLYIMHGEESTFSLDPRAFILESNQIGGMQRDKRYHPNEAVEQYFLGMENLLVLPVRHPDYPNDAKELNYAAAEISEYAGPAKDLYSALFKYSAAGPAEYRWEKLQMMLSLVGQ